MIVWCVPDVPFYPLYYTLMLIMNVEYYANFSGQNVPLEDVSLSGFLPSGTAEFITYEGSQTEPACHETVTWIIMNRPIYVTKKQVRSIITCKFSYREFSTFPKRREILSHPSFLDKCWHFLQLMGLRKLMQGEASDPRAPLCGNVRPTHDLNGRCLRTNVRVQTRQVGVEDPYTSSFKL